MIKNVVLDLDHTLVLAFTKTELRQHGQEVSPNLKMHFYDPFVIFERPGLGRFLEQLSSEYRVSVWTAGTQDYGQFIIDNIMTPYLKSPLRLFFHARQCDISLKRFSLLKHLDLLYQRKDFSRADTVLVDDNPDVLDQDNNVIHIKQFDLNPRDRSLAAALRKIRALQ